jgi:hypothetical protein
MTRTQAIKLLAEFFLDTFAEDAGDVANWWSQGDLGDEELDDFYELAKVIKAEIPAPGEGE